MIDETMIEHVSQLARLHLTGEERAQVQQDLNHILAYVDMLEELDTDGVVPTSHGFDVTNVFRADEVTPSQPVEEVLANSPDKTAHCFKVPRTVEG